MHQHVHSLRQTKSKHSAMFTDRFLHTNKPVQVVYDLNCYFNLYQLDSDESHFSFFHFRLFAVPTRNEQCGSSFLLKGNNIHVAVLSWYARCSFFVPDLIYSNYKDIYQVVCLFSFTNLFVRTLTALCGLLIKNDTSLKAWLRSVSQPLQNLSSEVLTI